MYNARWPGAVAEVLGAFGFALTLWPRLAYIRAFIRAYVYAHTKTYTQKMLWPLPFQPWPKSVSGRSCLCVRYPH